MLKPLKKKKLNKTLNLEKKKQHTPITHRVKAKPMRSFLTIRKRGYERSTEPVLTVEPNIKNIKRNFEQKLNKDKEIKTRSRKDFLIILQYMSRQSQEIPIHPYLAKKSSRRRSSRVQNCLWAKSNYGGTQKHAGKNVPRLSKLSKT